MEHFPFDLLAESNLLEQVQEMQFVPHVDLMVGLTQPQEGYNR